MNTKAAFAATGGPVRKPNDHAVIRFVSDSDGVVMDCKCGWAGPVEVGIRDAATSYGNHRAEVAAIEALARRDAGERGSSDLVGIIVGLAGAFLFALIVTFATPGTTHVARVTTVAAVTTPPAVTAAAPQAPVTAPPTETSLIPPKVAARPATGHTAPAATTTTTIAADPARELSCETLADGIDASAGNGVPGWYRTLIPADVAALNPDHVRNCTPAILP